MQRLIGKFSKLFSTQQSVKKISNYKINKKYYSKIICTNKKWLPHEIIITQTNGTIGVSGRVIVESWNDYVTTLQDTNLKIHLKNLLSTAINGEITKFSNDSIYNYTINALKSHIINNINVELHNINLNVSKAEIDFDSEKGDSIKINYDTLKFVIVNGNERYKFSNSEFCKVYFGFDEQNEPELEKFKSLLNTTIYNEIAELRLHHEKDNIITINDLKNKIMNNVNMIVKDHGLHVSGVEIFRR